jgi:methionyl aminopeptidase
MDAEIMGCYKKAGKIASEARDYCINLIEDGAYILKVVEKTEKYIFDKDAKPAFPVNISIGNVAAHFTPKHDDYDITFSTGNLVKVDIGVHVNGYIGDTATTIEVGSNNWKKLIEAAQEGLRVAVNTVRPGVDLGLIGENIERTINSFGYRPIGNLTGHSMDQYDLHAGISIPNIKTRTHDTINVGDIIAIEPFATDGAGKVKNDQRGNIYRLVKDKPMYDKKIDAMLRYIKEEFKTLPFAERWCANKFDDVAMNLQKLVRSGVIIAYPILKEVANGTISQMEHTVIVTENGAEVIT